LIFVLVTFTVNKMMPQTRCEVVLYVTYRGQKKKNLPQAALSARLPLLLHSRHKHCQQHRPFTDMLAVAQLIQMHSTT